MDHKRTEALLELQTRWITLPCGKMRSLTYTLLVWTAYDYLIDRGHFEPEQLVELANVDGWNPPNAPFEMRFSSVVAYWTHRFDDGYRDYAAYVCGRI